MFNIKLIKLFVFILSCVGSGMAQQQINDYKFISVPNQFEFQKETNSYEINALTKFLFNKYQFKAFLDSDNESKMFSVCEVLRVSMEKNSGFLDTKIKVILKDCNGKVVYTSPEGKSIKKDYKQAYHEAIRKALNDPRIKNHKYTSIVSKNKKPQLPGNSNLVAKSKPKQKDTTMPMIEKCDPQKELPNKKIKSKTLPKFLFSLRGKEYAFQKSNEGYLIFEQGKILGKAILLPNNVDYKVEAGNLSGNGSFDDYGNFVLKRINPANNKPITDIMAREN